MDFLSKGKKLWENYGFEIALGSLIIFLLILAFIRWRNKEKGSWSFFSQKPLYIPQSTRIPKKRPPQRSKGENECRRVLENIFNKPFLKDRPNFLRNPVTSGEYDNNLELDCYNDELKIACEYNGKQHYEYSPFMHKTKDSFYNQKYRDYIKRDLCEKNGIFLIEVPHTVKIDFIEDFIKNRLREGGYRI